MCLGTGACLPGRFPVGGATSSLQEDPDGPDVSRVRVTPRVRSRQTDRAPRYSVRVQPLGMGSNAGEIVRELFDRLERGEGSGIDDLIAEDMVNHAAGPQGREGWRLIIEMIDHDLGPIRAVHHAFIGDGDIVAHHMTMSGVHRDSTMPLLAGIEASGVPVEWTYIHIWRTDGAQIVEHWACRDDVSLLAQVGAWPR
jgi:predicted ester cyclase